jgi:copper chaperone CopZ
VPDTVTYTFTVEGMHCGSCGLLIDDELDELDGVVRTTTSVRAGRSTVEVDPTRCAPDDIVEAIAAAGYTARRETP